MMPQVITGAPLAGAVLALAFVAAAGLERLVRCRQQVLAAFVRRADGDPNPTAALSMYAIIAAPQRTCTSDQPVQATPSVISTVHLCACVWMAVAHGGVE